MYVPLLNNVYFRSKSLCSQKDFVTLERFAGFLCIKAVREIEDFEGSCSGKRQSRVRIRDRTQFHILL